MPVWCRGVAAIARSLRVTVSQTIPSASRTLNWTMIEIPRGRKMSRNTWVDTNGKVSLTARDEPWVIPGEIYKMHKEVQTNWQEWLFHRGTSGSTCRVGMVIWIAKPENAVRRKYTVRTHRRTALNGQRWIGGFPLCHTLFLPKITYRVPHDEDYQSWAKNRGTKEHRLTVGRDSWARWEHELCKAVPIACLLSRLPMPKGVHWVPRSTLSTPRDVLCLITYLQRAFGRLLLSKEIALLYLAVCERCDNFSPACLSTTY